jgi:hypothetical protein
MQFRAVTAACLCALTVSVARGAIKETPLTGTWRITEVKTTGPNGRTNSHPQPGYLFFTGNHYCKLVVTSDNPRPELPKGKLDESRVTVPQLLAVWGAFYAHGGTYSISGDTVKIQVDVASGPRTMENHEFIVYRFKIEGDELTLTPLRDVNGPTANPGITTLTRVE